MIWIRRGLIAFLLFVAIVFLIGWLLLRASLPQLDGTVATPGLTAPIAILRDNKGVVHLEGSDRNDTAFALGFAHAQDRFFQMDLYRRRASGNLSGLFGERALNADKAVRRHRFHDRARERVSELSASNRRLLEAYTRGVNAGLEGLDSASFEYLVLRADPEPWSSEDSVLCLYAMILLLQDSEGIREQTRGLLADSLPQDVYQFLMQAGGNWDAPLFGPAFQSVPVPETALTDLLPDEISEVANIDVEESLIPGSNNWALDGRFTPSGAALVADDMHLPLGLPTVWYRASWKDPEDDRLISGATLPGTPSMVVGSNEHIAWGWTNSQGDWSDVIILELDDSGERYRTPGGWAEFTTHEELIPVKGGEEVAVEVRETQWGPVVGEDQQGRPIAYRWTAHDPEGANFEVLKLEKANTAQDALNLARTFGIPQLNMIVGDRDGNIGWSLAGPIPQRLGFNGRLPTSWHTPNHGWQGFHDAASYPTIYNPDHGRLWTANARVLSGPQYDIMGDEGAALGARQQQIRDRLFAMERATPEDMLALQRDNEALFLSRWQSKLSALLKKHADSTLPGYEEAALAVYSWSGKADSQDLGYRLVRSWRFAVQERVFAPIDALMKQQGTKETLSGTNRQSEYPLWTLLDTQPDHWLNPAFATWEELEMAAFERVLKVLMADGTLDNDNWGEVNRLRMAHPLAGAIPLLGQYLAMDDIPMSGDSNMPFVQRLSHGASQRFGVSPGDEENGYFQIPGGQSGHPLSPYFQAGHEEWVEGIPSPWLIGEIKHRLELRPEQDGR